MMRHSQAYLVTATFEWGALPAQTDAGRYQPPVCTVLCETKDAHSNVYGAMRILLFGCIWRYSGVFGRLLAKLHLGFNMHFQAILEILEYSKYSNTRAYLDFF